jgi:DNA-binding transcriptional MocR family regulator
MNAISPPLPPPSTLYHRLADAVQVLIDDGTLRPGHRVPSVRRMSLQREVSVSTVVQAYTVLENRGLIEARPQSGYYVRAQAGLRAPEPRIARPMAQPSAVGVSELAADFMAYSVDPDYVPFGAACPHHSLFPNKKMARLLGSVGRDDPAMLGRYAMNCAYPPLARRWLAKLRGVTYRLTRPYRTTNS